MRNSVIKAIAIFICLAVLAMSGLPPVQTSNVMAAQNPEGSAVEILEVQPGPDYELNAAMFSNSFILNDVPRLVNITQMPMAEFVSKVEALNGKYDIIYIGNKSATYGTYTALGVKPATLPQNGQANGSSNYLEYYNGNDITNLKASKLKEYINTKQLVIFDETIFTNTLKDTKIYKNFKSIVDNKTAYPNVITVSHFSEKVKVGPEGDGFTGQYYNNESLATNGNNKLVFTQTDSFIDFTWGSSSPNRISNGPTVGPDSFSVRWTGKVKAVEAGTYTFFMTSDDGSRLFLNNSSTASINNWTNLANPPAVEKTFSAAFTAGQLVDIKMEYYDKTGDALAKLYWIYPVFTMKMQEAVTNYYGEYVQKRPSLKLTAFPAKFTGANYINDNMLSFKFDAVNSNEAYKMTAKLFVDKNGDGIFKNDELMEKIEDIKTSTDYTINYRFSDAFTGLLPWKIELIDNLTGASSYESGASAYKKNPLKVRVLQLIPNGNTLDLGTLNNKNGVNMLFKEGEYEITVTKMHINDFDNAYTNASDTVPPATVNVNGVPVTTVLNGNYDMIVLGFSDTYSGGQLRQAAAVKAVKEFIATGQSVMFTHDTMTYKVLDTNGWGYTLTKEFRDLIGQNVYLHDSKPDPNKFSYGFTRLTLDRANTGVFPKSTNAHKLNEGLISQYPNVLPDITVATTHHQYFQLDLEDEDVVVWYTLTGNSLFRDYDGRNDYYTYSKGTVTYSGTGHSVPNGIEENKLFVNTIIKASRGANHAPELKVFGISDGMNISPDEKTLGFSFVATDADADGINARDRYLKTEIFIDKNGDNNYTSDEKVTSDNYTVESGVTNTVSYNIENISQAIQSFKVKILVIDGGNAEAIKLISLDHKYEPKINVTVNKSGYLVNDTTDISFELKADNTNSSLVTRFTGIMLSETLDSKYFEVLPGGIMTSLEANLYGSTIEDLSFAPAKSWNSKQSNIRVKFIKEVKDYIVKNKLTYSQTNYNSSSGTWSSPVVKSYSHDYNLDVKSGTIDIEPLLNGKVGRAVPGINYTIKNKDTDIVVASGITGNTGLSAVKDLPTGNYRVSISANDSSYQIMSASYFDVSLSYTNSYAKPAFVLSGDPISNMNITDSNNQKDVNIRKWKNEIVDNTIGVDVTFELLRNIQTASARLVKSTSDISYTGTAKLYKGSTFVGDCSLSGSTFTLPPNLTPGTYRMSLGTALANTLSGGDTLSIAEFILKEPAFTEADSYEFLNSPIRFTIKNLPPLMENIAITDNNGSYISKAVKNSPVQVKASFTINRQMKSANIGFLTDENYTLSFKLNKLYKKAGSSWVQIPAVFSGGNLPADLEPGEYQVAASVTVRGASITVGSDIPLSLQQIPTTEVMNGKTYSDTFTTSSTMLIKVISPPKLR